MSYLPFAKETWQRVENWLGGAHQEYWLKADIRLYDGDDNGLNVALDKLVTFGRPHAALDCIHKVRVYKQKVNIKQCVKVLLAAAPSIFDASSLFSPYHTAQLIKSLQQSHEISPDDLFDVEWAYLPLLNGNHGVLPTLIENRLANDPNFFSQVTQLVYRSINSDAEKNSSDKERTSQQMLGIYCIIGEFRRECKRTAALTKIIFQAGWSGLKKSARNLDIWELRLIILDRYLSIVLPP